MLKKLDSNEIIICQLVESPIGRIGGLFPQYHTFRLDQNGAAIHETDFPESQTDTFCDENPNRYGSEMSHQEAIELLESELREVGVSAPGFFLVLYKAAKFINKFVNSEGEEYQPKAWYAGQAK